MKRGWTLVELVVTLGLTGLLAIPLGNVFAQLVEGTLEDHEQAVVMNLARARLEEVNSLPYADVVTLSSPLSNYRGFPYDLQQTVATQTPTDGSSSASIKRITVTVVRTGTTSPPLARVVTYRANGVASGS